MNYYEIHFDYTDMSGKDSDGYSKFFKSNKDVEDDTEFITNLAIEEGILDEDDIADLDFVDYAQKISEEEYNDATRFDTLTEADDTDEDVDEYEEIQDDDIDEVQETLEDLKNISGFYEFVVDDVIDAAEDYEAEDLKSNVLARCNSVLDNGCVSGIVGSLVYYSDTVAVFNEYADDIYDLIDDYGPDEFLDILKNHVNTTEVILNCDTSKNWIVWIAYEEVVYQIQNALESL